MSNFKYISSSCISLWKVDASYQGWHCFLRDWLIAYARIRQMREILNADTGSEWRNFHLLLWILPPHLTQVIRKSHWLLSTAMLGQMDSKTEVLSKGTIWLPEHTAQRPWLKRRSMLAQISLYPLGWNNCCAAAPPYAESPGWWMDISILFTRTSANIQVPLQTPGFKNIMWI